MVVSYPRIQGRSRGDFGIVADSSVMTEQEILTGESLHACLRKLRPV